MRASWLGFAVVVVTGCGARAPAEPEMARPDPARLIPLPVKAPPTAHDAPLSSPALVAVSRATAPSCLGEKGDECRGISCCSRIAMPEGTYDDRKAGKVHVSAFSLDTFEVTVGRIRQWNDAGAKTPAAGDVVGRTSAGEPIHWAADWKVQRDDALRGWARYDTYTAGDAQLPKNFISWYTATAFCVSEGGRLATDAEWHYAAVGGDENRAFPWGSERQTPERAIYNCLGDGNPSCSLADILPVGSRPLGKARWGHMDLAGSMFEWTADAGGNGGTAPARGGGFCYIGGVDRRVSAVTTSTDERHDAPSTVSHMVGARCAFDAIDTPRETASMSRSEPRAGQQ